MSKRFAKDPDAVLDYAFDWTDWLAEGESITLHTVTVDEVTKDSDAEESGVVTVWLSGGAARTTASATCRITTDQGRTDDRTIFLTVSER